MFAPRAALLLWIAAHAMSASSLPAQHEARYRVWKLGIEAGSNHGQPAPGSDPATARDLPRPTLAGAPAKPETPVELRPDVALQVFHFPVSPRSGPSRGAQVAVWMFLSAAALATTDARHRRRRAHAGCRHTRDPAPP